MQSPPRAPGGYPKETEKGLVDCDANGDKIRSVIQNDDADQQVRCRL